MKTTLPTLSYHPTGFSWSKVTHSTAYKKERAYPQTDLENLDRWVTFETEIHDAITTRMANMPLPLGMRALLDWDRAVEYDIGSMPTERDSVTCEEDVRFEAKAQLHGLVLEVLKILGIDQGTFMRSDSGRIGILGEPDFSWMRRPTLLPKVVVNYKTRWATPLEDLPRYLEHLRQGRCTAPEQRSIDAVHQLYGYMTFNDTKYGILSNLENAWFFQRVQADCDGEKTLQYHGPINIDSAGSGPSMLKAFVGIILLAEIASDAALFHTTPPTLANAPPPGFGIMTRTATRNRDRAIARAVAGSYEIFELDPRLCVFDRTSVRHAPGRGCTVRARLPRGILAGGGDSDPHVFCKIIDLFQRPGSLRALNKEVRNYATLENLQGVVIPRVRGYYNVWGLLRLLALEDVGASIPEDGLIDAETRAKMKSALSLIHSAGYIHGDIARRNFCKKANGAVFMVDLESLVPGSRAEMDAELAGIDELARMQNWWE